MKVRAQVAAALLAFALPACSGGCEDTDGKEKKQEKGEIAPPAVEGLEAVPASAQVVLGFDVPRLARSPLVKRALAQMFARDPELETRVGELARGCDVDVPQDLRTVLIAMGKDREHILLVASGELEENKIAACVGRNVSAEGGRVTTSKLAGRSVYHVEDGLSGGPIFFAFGSEETLVVSSSKAWLETALTPGDSARDNPDLARLIGRAGTRAGLWAAGFVPEEVGRGLLQSAGGRVGEPPRALFGHLELDEGIETELGAVMGSGKDAKELVSFAKPQLGTLALVAQERALGPLVNKIRVDSEEKVVYLRLSLTPEEVRELAARIDTEGGALQDSELPQPEGAKEDGQRDAPADGQAPVRQ